MIDEQMLILLDTLGADAINAFYLYLVLEYGSLWALIGLCAWAARVVWKELKDRV